MYTPPFNYTDKIVNLVAEITGLLHQLTARSTDKESVRLRKENRIKTIHSSLAIEGNNLTEDQVRDVIEGKAVMGPMREIQEVKNAIATYDMFDTLNPFKKEDLLRAHATMMMGLIDDAGKWRKSGVGVFGEKGCVHMAPPPQRVPELMGDLFEWLGNADTNLLVRSCVFHYEFEFIHPFSDGNGRTGRLWQSLILSRLHPDLANFPVENLVHAHQQEYYDGIAQSDKAGDSTAFIEYMLGEIRDVLLQHKPSNTESQTGLVSDLDREFGAMFGDEFGIKFGIKFGDNDKRLLLMLNSNPTLAAADLARCLSISQRGVEKALKRLRELNVLSRRGSTKNGLWEINKS